MNEVEKLYSLVGVEAKNKCKSSQCIVTNPHPDWCNECESLSKTYPPFTAEKQIYLIKFLSDKAEYLGIHYDRYKGLFEMQTDVGGLSIKNEFKEALASRVNVLWQDLTDAEKAQIKNILESEVKE